MLRGTARWGARKLNNVLSRSGLFLDRINQDFAYRLCDEDDLDHLFKALGGEIGRWAQAQQLFDAVPRDWPAEVELFYEAFLESPFGVQSGGSRFNNLLWLYGVARAFDPSLVVDSGTYHGASAWALDLAAPGKVLSFDIDLSRIRQRSPRISYYEQDWSTFDFAGQNDGRVLAYFDDHVDQVRRLLEAQSRRVTLAVFDDDFPVTSFAPMAHDGSALPKVEFALDERLQSKSSLRWHTPDGEKRWPVDADYLRRGRAAIAATERLPNTSEITGIHQTPYRVVRIRN